MIINSITGNYDFSKFFSPVRLLERIPIKRPFDEWRGGPLSDALQRHRGPGLQSVGDELVQEARLGG